MSKVQRTEEPRQAASDDAISRAVAAARDAGAVVLETNAGVMIAIPRRDEHAGDILHEVDAARIAGVSVRTLRDARRAGELVMAGRQRSRTVRRSDLDAWIESRRSPVATMNESAIDKRVARLERSRKSAGGAQ